MRISVNMTLRVLTFILLCSLTVFAQRATSLHGQITDQFGAVVVGVAVTVTDANGKRQIVQTDSNGAYRFDNLAAGTYSATVQQKGFASQTLTGLQVAAGS